MVQKDREFLSVVITMQCWKLSDLFRFDSEARMYVVPYFLAKSLIIFFKRLILSD